MRTALTVLGVGALAAAGLALASVYLVPLVALWVWYFGFSIWLSA